MKILKYRFNLYKINFLITEFYRYFYIHISKSLGNQIQTSTFILDFQKTGFLIYLQIQLYVWIVTQIKSKSEENCFFFILQ